MKKADLEAREMTREERLEMDGLLEEADELKKSLATQDVNRLGRLLGADS
jgi:hypothetical protein